MKTHDAAPVYPEVAAAQQRIRTLADAGRLRVFLDLHNSGPGDNRPSFYGPLDYEQMTGLRRRNYDRFLALATESITGPLPLHPQYRFATYVKTDEERPRVSGTWVRHHSSEDDVALTLETAMIRRQPIFLWQMRGMCASEIETRQLHGGRRFSSQRDSPLAPRRAATICGRLRAARFESGLSAYAPKKYFVT